MDSSGLDTPRISDFPNLNAVPTGPVPVLFQQLTPLPLDSDTNLATQFCQIMYKLYPKRPSEPEIMIISLSQSELYLIT